MDYALAKFNKGKNDMNRTTMYKKMKTIRNELKTVGRLHIERKIILKCKDLNVTFGNNGKLVKNMSELTARYQEDCSIDFAKIMWEIVIGQFDKCPDPFKTYEKEYMLQKKYKYANTESDQKLLNGFVYKYFIQA